MSVRSAEQEVESKLSRAGGETQRRLYFEVLLCAASEAAPGDFLVVGGSAIEVYTDGAYTSGDIDICAARKSALVAVLEAWGFRREARILTNDRLRLAVDLVGWPYTGDAQRGRDVVTPLGTVRLAAIEDLIVKRLSSAEHWRQPTDYDHAYLLAHRYRDLLDWGYVERFAHEHSVVPAARSLRDRVFADARGPSMPRRL